MSTVESSIMRDKPIDTPTMPIWDKGLTSVRKIGILAIDFFKNVTTWLIKEKISGGLNFLTKKKIIVIPSPLLVDKSSTKDNKPKENKESSPKESYCSVGMQPEIIPTNNTPRDQIDPNTENTEYSNNESSTVTSAMSPPLSYLEESSHIEERLVEIQPESPTANNIPQRDQIDPNYAPNQYNNNEDPLIIPPTGSGTYFLENEPYIAEDPVKASNDFSEKKETTNKLVSTKDNDLITTEELVKISKQVNSKGKSRSYKKILIVGGSVLAITVTALFIATVAMNISDYREFLERPIVNCGYSIYKMTDFNSGIFEYDCTIKCTDVSSLSCIEKINSTVSSAYYTMLGRLPMYNQNLNFTFNLNATSTLKRVSLLDGIRWALGY